MSCSEYLTEDKALAQASIKERLAPHVRHVEFSKEAFFKN
jgi:hypothetical protein